MEGSNTSILSCCSLESTYEEITLKGWIYTKYERGDHEFSGSVEAAPSGRDEQIKAKAVEFGRAKGNRGTTEAQPYIRLAQKLQGPKFKKSMKSAIKRGIKEAVNG